MIYYTSTPKIRDLIIYNTEDKEIFSVERISTVRTLIGDEVQNGDFEPNLKRGTGGSIDGGIHTVSRDKAQKEHKKRKPWQCPKCEFTAGSGILVGRYKRETEHRE
jgi:hypothetical protein